MAGYEITLINKKNSVQFAKIYVLDTNLIVVIMLNVSAILLILSTIPFNLLPYYYLIR